MTYLAILALDTSTEFLSVALMQQSICSKDEVISNCLCSEARFSFSHFVSLPSSGQEIISVINKVLVAGGLTLQEVDAIAYGRGPGSFTGLRLAASVTQGLTYATGIPVIAVDSLLATAEFLRICQMIRVKQKNNVKAKEIAFLNFLLQRNIRNAQQLTIEDSLLSPNVPRSMEKTNFTVLSNRDARMGEVYWAIYSCSFNDGDWMILTPPEVCCASNIIVNQHIDCFAGNQSTAIAQALYKAQIFCSTEAVPHSIAIARLAFCSWMRKEIISSFEAQPIYVRNRVALTKQERCLKKKNL